MICKFCHDINGHYITHNKGKSKAKSIAQKNIKRLDTNLAGLTKQFSSLEKETSNHNTRIESNKTTINTLLARVNDRKQQATNFSARINKLQQALKTAKQGINDVEQYDRRTMRVAQGIPYSEGENTNKIIEDIIDKSEIMQIEHNKIDISHRQRADQNAGIIVKFTDCNSRNIFYNSLVCLFAAMIVPSPLRSTIP